MVGLRKKGDVSELIKKVVTVERVNEYKYLGTVLDNKLTFECNTNNIIKKCHQRMFCMFRLRSFSVIPRILHMFYCSFIESVLTPCLVCLFGILSVTNRGKLNSIVNRRRTVVGMRQPV